MLHRSFSLVAAISLAVLTLSVSAFASEGNGHCGNKGKGIGHGHHDDDCQDPTPTPTASPTPTPEPTGTPVVTPTPSPNPTPTASGLVWKDAEGLVVPGVYAMSGKFPPSLIGLTYQDERGYLWELDPMTLQIDTIYNGTSPTIHRWYATSNCTGPAYFRTQGNSFFPRIVFRVDGETTYRSIPDKPSIVPVQFLSVDGGVGACQAISGMGLAIPATETAPADPIIPPTLPFTPPIHPE